MGVGMAATAAEILGPAGTARILGQYREPLESVLDLLPLDAARYMTHPKGVLPHELVAGI